MEKETRNNSGILKKTYGIGTPNLCWICSPLVRKHIDVLVGEYLTIPALPKVSCKDSDTVAKITEEKLAHINKTIGADTKIF